MPSEQAPGFMVCVCVCCGGLGGALPAFCFLAQELSASCLALESDISLRSLVPSVEDRL